MKKGTYPRVRIREWVVKEREENGKFLLICKSKGYTLQVDPKDMELIEVGD